MLYELTQRYLEPHRHYHTLDHPATMLKLARELGIELTPDQVWAIWFHDVIYTPGSKDNEARSAEMAVHALRLLVSGSLNSESSNPDFDHEDEQRFYPDVIRQIILDTAYPHVATIPESQVVIDLDLAGFAQPWEQYVKIQQLVRREFPALSQEQWLIGRAKFLHAMLERKPRYYTEAFTRPHLPVGDTDSDRARANMEREIWTIEQGRWFEAVDGGKKS